MNTNLPAGYVRLKHVAVHLSTLRRFTADPERFQRMVPTVESLTPLDPTSDEARAIYRRAAIAGDLDDLSATLVEYADLETTIAAEMQSGDVPEQPPIFINMLEAS